MRKQVTPGNTTPPEISVMQIDQDLKDGITKAEMAVKYNIKPWEVDEMFKHPFLKGRRPSRKKVLSFKFVDDTLPLNSGDGEVETHAQEDAGIDETDPNQVTLHDAIEEVTKATEEAVEEFSKAEQAITEILSPTEFESPAETIINANRNEEEIEMEDDTFEL